MVGIDTSFKFNLEMHSSAVMDELLYIPHPRFSSDFFNSSFENEHKEFCIELKQDGRGSGTDLYFREPELNRDCRRRN